MKNGGIVTRFAFIIFLAVIGVYCEGCSLASRSRRSETAPRYAEMTVGKGDAYLYDLKINRDGRKNSVRLDVYYNGDSLAVFARGYLGKGVLKGLLSGDSLRVYFPTENQYFSGSINRLVKNNCPEISAFDNLIMELFRRLPSEIVALPHSYYLVIDKDKIKSKKYRLISEICGDELSLEYDLRQNRFLPKKITYSNPGRALVITAERRQYRLNITLPPEKFRIDIPAMAEPLKP